MQVSSYMHLVMPPQKHLDLPYVRFQDATGQVKTALLMANLRVAPVKKITLPKLELLAAVVNSLNNLKINRVLCWTDISLTLY